jgi:hypothetical protein
VSLRSTIGSAAILLGLALALPAQAWAEDWSYRMTPYVWGSGLDGRVAQFGLPEIRVKKSFGDVLEELEAGAMVGFEARKKRWGVFGDVQYARLADSARISLPGQSSVFAEASLKTRTSTVLLAGQYRLLDEPKGYLDALAGLRHWSLSTGVRVRAPLLLTRRDSASWTDPVLGLKGFYRLGERAYFTGWAMLGGFDLGSRSSSDLMGALGWPLGAQTDLLVGYRYLAVDYRRTGYVFDAAQQGPAIGLDFRF